ncbi:MAG: carboxysome shell carbonic anhydrase [Pseudomonadota bacterium]
MAVRSPVGSNGGHPFVRNEENAELIAYEHRVKGAFQAIEGCLKEISTLRYDGDFVAKAQRVAEDRLGFGLPQALLEDSWIGNLDVGRLHSWCTFETFRRMSDAFFTEQPLAGGEQEFQSFIEDCGFHLVDVTPCADGRLAHVIRYVLRLPYRTVRRRSYAGALFDVEDSLEKWVETEMLRHREMVPNPADEPTSYLKIAVYHYSSARPDEEGCAAHGSDMKRAADGAWQRLQAFREGVENSYCCGASIDLLLIGLDTDNDAIRVHLPDANGDIDINDSIDGTELYERSRVAQTPDPLQWVSEYLYSAQERSGRQPPQAGMVRFAARLLLGNLSQIDYVRRFHNGMYSDLGHQEIFVGMGIGFEEVQLRNLTYFAYLKTVEEGAADLDVGIKIFSGLNVERGLPVPVVIRCDYHGSVPGARDRAEARCRQLDHALRQRFSSLVDAGKLHTLLMVRDCVADRVAETIACSALPERTERH